MFDPTSPLHRRELLPTPPRRPSWPVQAATGADPKPAAAEALRDEEVDQPVGLPVPGAR